MKNVSIEEKAVSMETNTTQKDEACEQETFFFDKLLPLMDLDGADSNSEKDTVDDGNGVPADESRREDIMVNNDIHIGLEINVNKPADGSDQKLGIVKDSSVTRVEE